MKYIELRLEFNSISPFLDVLKQELADIGFDSFMDNENGFSAFISNKLLDENLVLDLLNNYDDLFYQKILRNILIKIGIKNGNLNFSQ